MVSDLLLMYLGSFAVTMLALGITSLAYFRWSGRAAECEQERLELQAIEEEYRALLAKLPEAVRWADLSEKVADLEQKLDELRDEEMAARQTIAEGQRLAGEIEGHREELLKLEAERQQQEAVRAEIDLLKDENTRLKEENRKCQQEADAARFSRDQLTQEVGSLEDRRDRRQKELEKLEQSLQQSAKRQAEKEAYIATLTEEEAAARERVEKTGHQLDKLEKRHAELEGEVVNLEHQRRNLQEEERHLVDRIDRLQRRVDELINKVGPEEASSELWVPVLSDEGFDDPDDTRTERTALERVQDHLQSCGLQFPDRVVHALHTCFKIADMSPLVVLAGISGTGKSELPRRYAEAIGMHFLPVAVQPRWDSPQDMFGFFNYLEGRYRPTELTRVLVQMDPVRDAGERGWQIGTGYKSMADHMLVVLMDEMNLARVEYYFSELLSKLETRRGTDSADEQKRRKAEITLEMGKGGDNGQSNLMRLFVHTNVLFVGTMNEDESTQTLSDKVIDRANLLRFGKPHRLFAPQEDRSELIRAPVLEFEQWNDWLREEDDLGPNAHTVHRRFEHLNEIMARVGRPFAHRMFRAMRAYVANYPDFVSGRTDIAIADQVEQRILPRLRGLDVADHNVSAALDDLGRFIDDLGDQTLHHAFDEARDVRHHQFNWQGVDRSESEPAAEHA